MSESLSEFLLENPISDEVASIYPSERFKKRGLAFKIRPISGQEFADYQSECTSVKGQGKNRQVSFDTRKYNSLIALNHTVEPNFKDAQLLQQANCTLPEQFLFRSLKAGELQELCTQILVLSGFDNDMSEQVDEVKNS